MTTKADFTEEEWVRLGRAPLVAGMAISLADPGGPIEAIKESSAAIRTVLDAAQSGDYGEFVQAVAADVAEKTQHRQSPLGGFKPKGRNAGEEILDELRAVNALLVEKTTPEEADQFRELLKTAAQNTAKAAKEGGFLGFRAELVSEREQQMLDRLAEVFYGERVADLDVLQQPRRARPVDRAPHGLGRVGVAQAELALGARAVVAVAVQQRADHLAAHRRMAPGRGGSRARRRPRRRWPPAAAAAVACAARRRPRRPARAPR